MKVIIFCFTFLFLASTFNIYQEENDDKVKVDYYFESLCPYCLQFMEGSLKKAAATKVYLP